MPLDGLPSRRDRESNWAASDSLFTAVFIIAARRHKLALASSTTISEWHLFGMSLRFAPALYVPMLKGGGGGGVRGA